MIDVYDQSPFLCKIISCGCLSLHQATTMIIPRVFLHGFGHMGMGKVTPKPWYSGDRTWDVYLAAPSLGRRFFPQRPATSTSSGCEWLIL